jgi:tRNA pseudouridine13 synthase
MTDVLPYLVEGFPALSAVFKERWEDFEVEEIPLHEPEGHGDHTWMEVEKRGLTTMKAASDLALALGVKASEVGYAGMKDTRAVARQWMSVEHVAPEAALALDIPRVRVLRARRHPKKLRRGWHAGNRFRIRLRALAEGKPYTGRGDPVGVARSALDHLAERGVPNYYGPQRFGYRGDTWRVGRALARGEWGEAAGLIAGRPLGAGDPGVDAGGGVNPDRGDILRARELFEAGAYAEAAATWPSGFSQCARLASAMARTGGDAARALPVVGKRMLRLYAEAYQAWLFNQVLADRIHSLDRCLLGELAWKHDTDALFPVEDPGAVEGRAERFEISPTGPLVGQRLRTPSADAGEIERVALRHADFRSEELESAALRPLTGRRRPLRFQLRGATVVAGTDDVGPYLEVGFELPPGCYATSVLRELGRGGIIERGTTVAPPVGGP